MKTTETTKHTPGPWHVLPVYTGTSRYPIAHHLGDGAMGIIGEFFGQGGVGEEVTANARLAASAPELLAFARAFVASGDRVADVTERANLTLIARAAIAKATGGGL